VPGPQGWTQYRTEAGEAYYHNSKTQETTWARCTPSACPPPAFEHAAAASWLVGTHNVALTLSLVLPGPPCHADGTRQSAGRMPRSDQAISLLTAACACLRGVAA
jgi:hypothetical protein